MLKRTSTDTIYSGLHRPDNSFLQTLYSESAQRVLQQGVPPPTSNTIYSPPACSDLQQLLNELSRAQSTSLKAMTP